MKILHWHQFFDLEYLHKYKLIAQKLRENPELWKIPFEVIKKEKLKGELTWSGEEWERILKTKSKGEIFQILEDPGDEATKLRQSFSPFIYLLSEEEREEIYNLYLKKREEQNFYLHRLYAQKLRENPERWNIIFKDDFLENDESEKWKEILKTKSKEEILQILEDQGEEATLLKSQLPFYKVLTALERFEIFDWWKELAARSYTPIEI